MLIGAHFDGGPQARDSRIRGFSPTRFECIYKRGQANPMNDPAVQLLLCDADDHAPTLDQGFEASTLHDAQAPRSRDSFQLEALHGDPNDLEAQRWAVIAAEGKDGDGSLQAITALIDHRRSQQDAAPLIYRVPAGMDALQAQRWKLGVLRDESVALHERPRYLLILGDLDGVSLELQHTLANGSFVGRLHCPTAAGYRAYAEKLVACETAKSTQPPRSLFYTVQDQSRAVGVGYRNFIEPSMSMQGDWVRQRNRNIEGPLEIPYSDWSVDAFLKIAGEPTASLLCSLSHGIGAPRRGWSTPERQQQLQGALAVLPGEPLTADMVEKIAFLPGGIWFCVACFGAGTPAKSAYHSWFSLLAEHGHVYPSQVRAVLRSLAVDKPFVAALPQALLANPNGPLAVIGHMDLAWTYSFTDPMSNRSRASQLFAVQRALLSGSRVGVALDTLMHTYRETNDNLMAHYQLRRDAAVHGQPDPVSPKQLGMLWMQRNDLRGYVLLGDPAARLAIAG